MALTGTFGAINNARHPREAGIHVAPQRSSWCPNVDLVVAEMTFVLTGWRIRLRLAGKGVDRPQPLTRMRQQGGHTYIMASRRLGTLYVGVTANLPVRVWQHRHATGKSFTGRYGVNRLVWAEWFDDISEAIAAEKRIKKLRRLEKVRLIEELNPDWRDLSEDLS